MTRLHSRRDPLMTGLHRLLSRLVCHATTHDPSWAAGFAHGYDRPICSTCHRLLTVPEVKAAYQRDYARRRR